MFEQQPVEARSVVCSAAAFLFRAANNAKP